MTIIQETQPLGRFAILAFGLLLRASSICAQIPELRPFPPSYSAREVQVRIDARQSSSKIGDSVNVRITMRNVSDHAVGYPIAPIDIIVGLRVLDADGREVKRGAPQGSGMVGGIGTLKAGQEITFKSQHGQEWINLMEWGYDLRAPGSYTLAVPSLRSSANRVPITVTK